MCVYVCICAPGITVPEPKPRFIIFTAFAISHCLTIFWAVARWREGIYCRPEGFAVEKTTDAI